MVEERIQQMGTDGRPFRSTSAAVLIMELEMAIPSLGQYVTNCRAIDLLME